MIKLFFFVIILFISLGCEKTSFPLNVLFITVDDLRPDLGGEMVIAPNINNFKKNAMEFNRAYCNIPVCGASRSSFLTGLRPSYNRFNEYFSLAEVETPNISTIPEQFKKKGYKTISIGKIFHTGGDNENAWSSPPFRLDHFKKENGEWSDTGWFNYLNKENISLSDSLNGRVSLPWEIYKGKDSIYFDEIYANKTIEYINQFSKEKKPFFLAVGFLKPHLPFNAQKKYWDLYNVDSIRIANNYFLPKNAPEPVKNFNWGELRNYHGIPKNGLLKEKIAKKLIHGYYACVSSIDFLIGRIIKKLDETGLRKNTIIVLMSDHGFNLSEHTFWCKHINFETSTRTMLVIDVPNFQSGLTESIVELVDIYPTLVELCQLDSPNHSLDGQSILPVLNDPEFEIKDYAISKYKNGISLIEKNFSYTEWLNPNKEVYSKMFFDKITDPKENINQVDNPYYKEKISKMKKKLKNSLGKSFWDKPTWSY